MRFPLVVCVFVCFAVIPIPSFGQSPNGNINGLVSDPTNAAVANAEIVAVNDVTGVQYTTKTNSEGIYVLPNLPPGPYRVQVSKIGFKTLIKPDITLNVQDSLSINFTLLVGAFHEVVTVQGGAPVVNTENAAVSTVVDRQYTENLPMNGRSFQTLIYLTPGVVPVPTNPEEGGQFAVDGQRPSSNYWMVDGVSANVGMSATPTPGGGLSGALGSFSALGGTNSLVSLDAMQEFRIQTSTFAPEFGRTPGAQISIVTRSGQNQFHGTSFDYLRNDLLDANDWFADNAHLAKPEERQNDFGGTFSGPILKDHTFFFFSYEGLRLRLPQVALDTVPDLSARQNAVAAMQPYLNAFPFDPNQPDLGNGIAQFNASYSNAATLDAYSFRIDHRLKDRWALFGRYNYSPSKIVDRGASATALSVVTPTSITTQTLTLAATTDISPVLVNDLRFNYSRTSSFSTNRLDSFGGAVPITSLPFPQPFTAEDSFLAVGIFGLKGSGLSVGRFQQSWQRQFNVVETFSMQEGRHGLKFGIDFRRLSPIDDPRLYVQAPLFFDMPSALAGTPTLINVTAGVASTFLFRNLGAYAQDTWHATSRLTLTYGLRWDVDFAPSSLTGPNVPAVNGYDLFDLGNLSLAPPGTPPFRTTFGDLAPRLGVAYELSSAANWQTVLRGGVGVFYDLASSEVGNLATTGGYPFGASNTIFGGSFPLSAAAAEPPAITPASLAICCNAIGAFNPQLQLPYTIQWNVALQQGLANGQSISASYVGASGGRLLQTTYVLSPNPNFYAAQLVDNTASSNYNGLQLQLQRRLSHGLQALASYTWSHSIDDGSAGSNFFSSNAFVPGLLGSQNRASSDFDVRHALSAGLTYDIPLRRTNAVLDRILQSWSVQSFVIASSAPPVDIYYGELGNGALLNAQTDIRPDVVPGQSFDLYGAQCVAVLGPPCAGGKGFNPAAFTPPPLDPSTGNPLRQGTLGRNALRGFGLVQWDFAVHHDIPIGDLVKLQFRAEMFNVLNHPNFGQPSGNLGSQQTLSPQFGQSQSMLGNSLSGSQYAGNVGGGSFNPLYQIGGPRSIQLALKLTF